MPSAYIVFSTEKRDSVKAKNPQASFGQIGKILGEMWGALSDAEKAQYKAKATPNAPKALQPKASKTSKKAKPEKKAEKKADKKAATVAPKSKKGK
jgi:hypothetical protein